MSASVFTIITGIAQKILLPIIVMFYRSLQGRSNKISSGLVGVALVICTHALGHSVLGAYFPRKI